MSDKLVKTYTSSKTMDRHLYSLCVSLMTRDLPELSSAVAFGAVFAVDGLSATSTLASGVAARAVCGRWTDFNGGT